MIPLAPLILLSAVIAPASRADTCPQITSCSPEAQGADSCCVPNPGGLFVFRQRFEPDVDGDLGRWGIDGLEVLNCETQQPLRTPFYPKAYSHEEIGSFCLKTGLFGGEKGFSHAEGEWAQSEVGEGVEELWDRSWSSAGRFISTLAPNCMTEEPKGTEVPLYFNALQKLHKTFPIAKLLADADITPSADTTYSLSELVAALSIHEHKPVVVCNNMTLSSVSWPLHVRGTFQDGAFMPALSFSRASKCPTDGITYPHSTIIHKPTPTPSWDPLRRPQPRPITMSHDESRLYYQPDVQQPPSEEGASVMKKSTEKLVFFKGRDENRERKGNKERQFRRDEL